MLKKHNWRRELVYLGLISMETCWLATLFVVFAGMALHAPLGLAALAIGGLLLLSTSLARALGHLRFAPRFYWAAMTISMFLVLGAVLGLRLYPAVSPDRPSSTMALLVAGLIVFAWWRGNLVAQTDVASPNVVTIYFWIGLSVFLLLIVLGHFLLGQTIVTPTVEATSVTEGVIGFVPAYFLLSLITTGLARIEEVVQLPESTAASPRTGYWLALLIASAGGVTLTGLLLSTFFGGGGLARSLSWSPPLFEGVGRVLYAILDAVATAIATVLAYLVRPVLEWWASLELPNVLEVLAQSFSEMQGEIQKFLEEAAARDSVGVWALLGRWVVIGFVILIVLRAGRAIRLRRREAKSLVDDASEDHLSPMWGVEKASGSLVDGLARWRDRLRQGLRFLYALSVRHIYANLLRLAAHRGHKRLPAQTPYEFQAVLGEMLPGRKADVQTITRAYVRAHYGQSPESRTELNDIRQAWRRIRAAP
jgi:hypothetical protein